MFKCPFGFLWAFVYTVVYAFISVAFISLIDDDPRRHFGKNSRLFGTRQFFELLEDSVSMTSCLVSKPRQLGDRRFTALVGWWHRFKVINLLRSSAFLVVALRTIIIVGLLV